MARRTIRCVGAACIIALVLTLTPVLSAQRSASQPEPAALQALLQEVQLLRTAIERAVLVNSRMQLSLLRLNAEQQRVADLSGVVRTVQADLASITAETLLQLQLADDARRSRDRDRSRSQVDQEYWDHKVRNLERQLEALATREQQLRTRENDAIFALQSAEARLNDQNSRLDQIEQLLSEPPRRY